MDKGMKIDNFTGFKKEYNTKQAVRLLAALKENREQVLEDMFMRAFAELSARKQEMLIRELGEEI
jgi:hypothetical protein